MNKITYFGDTTLSGIPENTEITVLDGTLTVEGDVEKQAAIIQRGTGGVTVNGTVKGATLIDGTGNVTINGVVARGERQLRGASHNSSGVTIRSGGNLKVTAGVGNYANLRARGDIEAISIASSGKVKAGGNVTVHYAIYNGCEVEAGCGISARELSENVTLTARNGSIAIKGDVEIGAKISQSGNGNVAIGGHVGAESKIKSSGSVTVGGTLRRGIAGSSFGEGRQGVSIQAEKDITIGAGIGNHATLISGGNIQAVSIASGGKLKAGGNVTVAHDIYNDSHIQAGGKIKARALHGEVKLEENLKPKRSFVDRLKSGRNQASTQIG